MSLFDSYKGINMGEKNYMIAENCSPEELKEKHNALLRWIMEKIKSARAEATTAESIAERAHKKIDVLKDRITNIETELENVRRKI